MVSLKGYALQQFVGAESSGGCENIRVHPVKGTSLKIGSSFVCHIVLKELLDVHMIISVNEQNQVTIRNLCTTSPITINGAVVAPGTALLEVGDTIEVLGHRFVWHKEDSPDTSIDGSLEASFQIDNPMDKKRRYSEPRLANHKWVAFSKENQSIHFGAGEYSSCSDSTGSDTELAQQLDKENNCPSSATIPESSEAEGDEAAAEKTILHELNEHSMSALIDLSTPETPAVRESVNFIDLDTPAPVRGRTPVRATPKTSSKLLKKILDPRISMSTVESDFKHMQESAGQSTPMVNRGAAGPPRDCESPALVDMSDINESTQVSEQSTIISNHVPVAAGEEEVPETQPEDESMIDELFEDAQEVAQSDIGLCSVLDANPLQLSCGEVEVDENGDEYIPSTQTEQAAASETVPPPASPEPHHPEEGGVELEMAVRTFTPRKSLRTPKKIDHNQCCTPKSLSKVVLTEAAQRRSPRVSRMNLSLRMDSAKSSTPVVSKSLSKSLMVSKLMRSAKKSVVEISDDSESEAEEAETVQSDGVVGEEGAVVLADETLRQGSPVLFADSTINNTVREYDSDVILIGSQEASVAVLLEQEEVPVVEVKCEQREVVEDTRAELEPVTASTTDGLIPVQPIDTPALEDIFEGMADPQCPQQIIVGQGNSVAHSTEEEGVERDDHEDHLACSGNVDEDQLIERVATEPMGGLEEPSTEHDVPTAPIEERVDAELLEHLEEELIEEETIGQLDEELTETAASEPVAAVDIVGVADASDSAVSNMSVIVEELYKSPMKILRREAENSPLKGSDSLQKTPKSKALAEDDSQRLARSPLQNMSNMVGVRELFKTPKATDVEKSLTGLRELMKTPHTVMHVTTNNMVGLREMMKTPGRLFPDTNLTGMREMLKTPAPKKQTNLVGLKELVASPVQPKEANYVGIKELVNTPKPPPNAKLLGVREMMQTPKATQSLQNTVGVKELFSTPQAAPDVKMVGLREMLQTPKPSTSTTVNTEDIADMFKTPAAVPQGKRIVWEEQEARPEENEVAPEEPAMEGLVVEEEGEEEEDTKSIEAVKREEEEGLALNTSAELFDKMMNRKSVALKHTYSRQTPIKQGERKTGEEPTISPAKKEEVERWVESIIVASNGETKKIVNNNLQVMSDRYSNVTPSQAMKAESVLLKVLQEEREGEGGPQEKQQQQNEPESKLTATEVIVTVEETQPPPASSSSSTDAIESAARPSQDDVEGPTPPKDPEANPAKVEVPTEGEKPRRGRRAVPKLITEEVITPRTPLRTRRNLRVDLEETPRASPRLRRAASLKLEDVKVTPARSERKPKVQTTTANDTVAESEEPQTATEEQTERQEGPTATEKVQAEGGPAEAAVAESESVKQKRGGRTKKKVEGEAVPSPVPTPQRRGRRPKAIEKVVEAEAEVKATPTRRGRKPAAAAAAKSAADEHSKRDEPTDTPAKRRGRAAPKRQAAVDEEKSPETEEQTAETPAAKPVGRGRGRRAVAVAKSDEGNTTNVEEAPKATAARGGRKKKAEEQTSGDVEEPATESEPSVVDQRTETTTATEEEEEEEGDVLIEKPKPTRGRKGAVKKAAPTKRKVEEVMREQQEEETATPAKRGRPAKKKETVKPGDSEEEPLVAKRPVRGRRAATLKHEESTTTANESVSSTPPARKKPAAKKKVEEVMREQQEEETATPAKRGRPAKKKETVKPGDSEEEPLVAKRPVRGRRAATLKHEE